MGKSKIDLKKKKLMKLLGVKEEFFDIRGIQFGTQNKDGEETMNDIDTFNNMDYSNLDFSDIKLKEKMGKTKKIDRFEVKVRRSGVHDSIEPPNPFFPSIPFGIYELGVVKAGKSTVLDNMIDLYGDAFDSKVMISPTALLDGTAVEIQERYGIEHVYKSLDALKPLVKYLERVNMGKNDMRDKVKVLIIMDDCINEIKYMCAGKNSFLSQMSLNRRHLGISFIMLSQDFRACPPVFRKNFNCFIIFRMENEPEKKRVCEELSGFLGMKKFDEVFTEATQDDYSFFSINLDAKDKKYQYTRNFCDILIENDFTSKTMDGLDSMNMKQLQKLARVCMIDIRTTSKDKLRKMIRDKMDNLNDSMETEELDLIEFDENDDLDEEL